MKQIFIFLLSLVAMTTSYASSFVENSTATLYTSNELVSSAFTCIMQDHDGYMWIGTENGLNKFDGYRFTAYNSNRNDSTSLIDNDVTAFFNDSKNRIWVGCNRGLVRFLPETNKFLRYTFPENVKPRITSFAEDKWNNLLICTAGYGIFVLRDKTDELELLDVKLPDDSSLGHIFMDYHGNMWVAGYAGTTCQFHWDGKSLKQNKIFKLESAITSSIDIDDVGFTAVCRNNILRYKAQEGEFVDAGYNLSELGENVFIKKAIKTARKDIIIGTTNNGMWVIHDNETKLQRVHDYNNVIEVSAANIIDILEDNSKSLWACCHNKGLYQVELPENTAFRNISFQQNNVLLGSGISSMVRGEKDDWFVTVSNHVFRFTDDGKITPCEGVPHGITMIHSNNVGKYWLAAENTLYEYDPYKGKSRQVLTFPGQGVMCMAHNNNDNELYICNFGRGFTIYNTETKKTEAVKARFEQENGMDNAWILSMYCDKKGRLWLGTADGLECRVKGANLVQFRKTMKGVMITSITENIDGDILIGTRNGLYCLDGFTYEAKLIELEDDYDARQEIENLNIRSMVTDGDGNIWLGCTDGLYAIRKNDARGFKVVSYFIGKGTISNEFVATPPIVDGNITFATLDGLSSFNPEDVDMQYREVGNVHLTNVFVDGILVPTRFDFAYDVHSISFEFSLLDFRDTRMTSFLYSIDEGRHWINVPTGMNSISFANLSPNTYKLQVRAMANGELSPVETIQFVVHAPFYATTLAYIIYIILLCTIVFLVVRYYVTSRRKKMDEAKMQFLINATHEIRSPLTLILDPLRSLKSKVTDISGRMDIETIERSTNRLLSLVNDILDIRKIDKKLMHLHPARTEMGNYVSGICQMYQYNANQKGIRLRFFNTCDGDTFAWIDRVNFDKIISNLISNALKYTPEGGFIAVKMQTLLDDKGQRLVISVSDTGTGLAETEIKHLFERFYQGLNAKDISHAGSGIGLNLCKTLVEMHGGTITAANRTDNCGAIFTVNIPMGNQHFNPEDLINEDKPLIASESLEHDRQEEQTDTLEDMGYVGTRKGSKTNLRLLIVDDDEALMEYMTRNFKKIFSVDSCKNGAEGLTQALKVHYDVIISDVMMPEMDGFTMLRKLKTNANTCDIPIILLTSKTEAQDRLQGLKIGADAYLAKPFNLVELQTIIENLASNRKRLRGKYSGSQKQEEQVANIQVKGNDEKLMEKIMKTINENMSNPDFNIEQLADTIGISRVQLHRKMKDMTGLSSGQFLRNLRMEQAARLIREDKVNVAQVAYLVGFVSNTHFSTAFKKYFGMTPREYLDSQEQHS